jgi:hypothetical protein
MTTSDDSHVREVAGWIYGVAIALFVALWVTMIGILGRFRTPMIVAGLPGVLLGVGLLSLNCYLGTSEEVVSGYALEKRDADEVQRNSFYITAALFSVTGIVMRLNEKMVHTVSPLLLMTLFFAVILVLAPVWVSTEDSQQLIILKHARTASFLSALGFMTTAVGLIFFLDTDPSGRIVWSLAQPAVK